MSIIFTEDRLTNIAKEHSEFFTTQKTWNNYAKEHTLPSSKTFQRVFCSWVRAKRIIFKNTKD